VLLLAVIPISATDGGRGIVANASQVIYNAGYLLRTETSAAVSRRINSPEPIRAAGDENTTHTPSLYMIFALIAFLGIVIRPEATSAATDCCIASRLENRGLYPRRWRLFSMETQELRTICLKEEWASLSFRRSFH